MHFVPQSEHVTAIRMVDVLFNGAPETKLVQRIPDSIGSLLIDVAGIGQTIILKRSVEVASWGTVLVQKL